MNDYINTWHERLTNADFWISVATNVIAFAIAARLLYGEWFWNA